MVYKSPPNNTCALKEMVLNITEDTTPMLEILKYNVCQNTKLQISIEGGKFRIDQPISTWIKSIDDAPAIIKGELNSS